MRPSLHKMPASWLGFAYLLIVGLFGSDVPRAFPQIQPKKQPVPDQAARDQGLMKVQAQLKEAFPKAATDPKAKVDAANFLIKQAGQAKIAGDQYVFLDQARLLATQAGDVTIALW